MLLIKNSIIMVRHLWYREDFELVYRFQCSEPHGDRCTIDCKTRANFADESAGLVADNIRNEGK
jgi:hypothetical protein